MKERAIQAAANPVARAIFATIVVALVMAERVSVDPYVLCSRLLQMLIGF